MYVKDCDWPPHNGYYSARFWLVLIKSEESHDRNLAHVRVKFNVYDRNLTIFFAHPILSYFITSAFKTRKNPLARLPGLAKVFVWLMEKALS